MTELEQWIRDNNRLASAKDTDWFNEVTSGLPDDGGLSGNGTDSNGQRILCGTGPHCVQAFAGAMIICQPKAVLEIGTNLGKGSAVMLALGAPQIHSIDISTRAETAKAARVLSERYPGCFHFECVSSAELLRSERDMPGLDFAFIDGDHSEEGVRTDIALCRKFGIKNMLFDDWYPEYGPGVQPAIRASGLKLRAIFGNSCLCSEP